MVSTQYLLNDGTNTPEHPTTVPTTQLARQSSLTRASGSPIQLFTTSSPRTAPPRHFQQGLWS